MDFNEFSSLMASLPKQLGSDLVKDFMDYGNKIRDIPGQADRIAEAKYQGTGSARDSSAKNAFRHALRTGMLSQEWGGGPIAAALAKGAGYVWEGLGANEFINSKTHRTDTGHDLNANAIGAKVATETSSHHDLVEALYKLSQNSRQSAPPSIFAPSPGYMTRTVR